MSDYCGLHKPAKKLAQAFSVALLSGIGLFATMEQWTKCMFLKRGNKIEVSNTSLLCKTFGAKANNFWNTGVKVERKF